MFCALPGGARSQSLASNVGGLRRVQLFRNQAFRLGASLRTIRKGVKVKHNLYKLAIGVVVIMCCVMIAQALEAAGKTATKTSAAKVEKTATKDIADTIAAKADLKKLADALKSADLVTVLKGPGPFTVFAATDEAFAKLPVGTLEGWMKPMNKAKLAGILNYEIVKGKYGPTELAKEKTLKTVQGQSLTVVVEKDVVTLDGAKVIGKEIVCTNGVIHLIDKVVEPKEVPAAVEKPAAEKPAVEKPVVPAVPETK